MKKTIPDVLVADLRLPGKTAYGLLDWVKKHAPALPVVVVSGCIIPEEKRRLLAAGAAYVMPKTGLPSALWQGIQQVLRGPENSSMTTMFAAATHQLQNPIQVISLLSHKLQQGGLTGAEASLLHQQTQYLGGFVPRVLKYLRLTKTQTLPRPNHVCLRDMLGRVVARFRAQCQGISLSTQGVNDGPRMPLWADSDELEEALSAMMENLCTHTPPGARARITLGQQQGQPCMTWTSHGVGLSQRRQGGVFTPFQASATGYGLGLCLVMRIMQLHGGTVTVVSDEKTYTKFVLYWGA